MGRNVYSDLRRNIYIPNAFFEILQPYVSMISHIFSFHDLFQPGLATTLNPTFSIDVKNPSIIFSYQFTNSIFDNLSRKFIVSQQIRKSLIL
jgi:hypothetical protein